MKDAVGEGGTGGGAQLANYSLLGKTGTAVRFEGGRYVTGEYTASFAALFPADNPQLVVVVKIDNPTGKYYGGLTAAPVTRTMLQQALASRRIGIDRSRLTPRTASIDPSPRAATAVGVPRGAFVAVSARPPERRGQQSRTLRADRCGRQPSRSTGGDFRVSLRGLGQVTRTLPAAGESANAGSAVIVWAE